MLAIFKRLMFALLYIALLIVCLGVVFSTSKAWAAGPTPITQGWEPTPNELQTLQRALQLPGMQLDLTGWSLQVYRSMDHPMHWVDAQYAGQTWEYWTDTFIPPGGKCVKGVIKSTPHKRLRILHMTRNDVDYHNARLGQWLKCGMQYYGNYQCTNLASLIIHERYHLAPYSWQHDGGAQDAYFQAQVDATMQQFMLLNHEWLQTHKCGAR